MDKQQDVFVSKFIAACFLFWLTALTYTKLIIFIQLLSVLLYRPLLMDLSPTLPTTHLTMIWALWPLMTVKLDFFWNSP